MNAAWEDAIKNADVQTVLQLLGQGQDVDALDRHGQTALMLAAHAGHQEIARLLAQAGADLSLRGSGAPGFSDKTAFDLAADRGMLELSAELKDRQMNQTGQ